MDSEDSDLVSPLNSPSTRGPDEYREVSAPTSPVTGHSYGASSPTVAQGYDEGLPEVVQRPGHESLEVVRKPGYESLEVAPGSGLERHYEGLESPYIGSDEEEGKEKEFAQSIIQNQFQLTPRRSHKRLWIALIILAIIIIVAAVTGAIEGSKTHSSNSSINATFAQSPSILGSSGATSETLYTNTSIAAASCPGGDRWVFVQDKKGILHVASFTYSSSDWTTFSSNFNVTDAKIGSPLAASCENISQDLGQQGYLNPGQFISLAYIRKNNTLGQRIFNGGPWVDPSVYQPDSVPQNLQLPNNTKLSVSVRAFTYTNPPGEPGLSSVVAYQADNTTLTMTSNSVGDDLLGPGPPNILNRFQTFKPTKLNFLGIGLSCIWNYPMPPEILTSPTPLDVLPPATGQAYGRCFVADSRVQNLNFFFNNTETANSWQLIDIDSSVGSYPSPAPILPGADLSSVPFSDNQTALVSVTTTNTIQVSFASALGLTNGIQTASPIDFPYLRFAATACFDGSTMLYLYYQVNGSTIGEISYDKHEGKWSSQPTYLEIF